MRDVNEELKRYLGPEYILFKNTRGIDEPYIEGWMAIELANKVFGYDQWTTEIITIETVDITVENNRVSATAMAKMRVTLKDGIFREDVGFGVIENQRRKGTAIQLANKSAVTDALKRALRQFGNALGNCCSDKHYIKAIKKQKNIHRKPINLKRLIHMDEDIPETKQEIRQDKFVDIHKQQQPDGIRKENTDPINSQNSQNSQNTPRRTKKESLSKELYLNKQHTKERKGQIVSLEELTDT
ncbi:DNA repair and recombination protein RAD52 [Nematocida sp. AWRm80]|nr:DNA repair and recombination protein RAD52 [Nematocida sp. AWRm80]